MIYNGQESGEDAVGEIGYSGDDGRTSIFDYCHMPKHQNWMNGGKFDGGGLDVTQKKVFDYYYQQENHIIALHPHQKLMLNKF